MRSLYFALIAITLSCSCSNNSNKISQDSSSIHIASSEDPASLDPRLIRDLPSTSLMRLLYEGLMRTSLNGEIIPGIAKNFTISEDKKTYTFHLRPSVWSDGAPLTATDFEQTWKSVLSPTFPAPNAYQLYLIKGAKAAKEGKSSSEAIGIKVLDPLTLVVELEQPAPYFLEMVCCHFFFPVPLRMRQSTDLSSIENSTDKNIGNGPFKLENWVKRSELIVVKNPQYWNEGNVSLTTIKIQPLDEHTALQLFKAGKLDWVGSPLCTLPQDAISTLKKEGKLQIALGAGTHWVRVNTLAVPFNSEKMRRAFALAIDRQAIVEHITQGNQQPAIGIVPPSFGFKHQNYFADHDIVQAQILFKEALLESNLSKSTLPSIALSYASNDRNHKIAQAIQQQWNQAFGINVTLAASESQVQLEKVKNGQYDVSLGSWYADIQDPINFLEIFKSKDNPPNQTFWQNHSYVATLERSSMELDSKKRNALLEEAEAMLIKEMPIIPLFHNAYNYLKNDQLEQVYFSPLGYLDFKEAIFH